MNIYLDRTAGIVNKTWNRMTD